MLVKIAILVELLAVMICVHRVYGEKVKINIALLLSLISMYITINVVNEYELGSTYALLAYIILFIYCIFTFHRKIIETVIGIIISILLVACIQFICILLCILFPVNNEIVIGLISNIVMLLIVYLVFPYLKINKLYKAICKKHWLMYIALLFCAFVLLFSIMMGKIRDGIDISFFLFGIPATIIILLLVFYWEKTETKRKIVEQEVDRFASMEKQYDDLVDKIKANQHALKDHLMTLEIASETYNVDENSQRIKMEYYDVICKENRENDILLVGDKIIGGFLYGKMLEAEKKGVELSYKIESAIDDDINISRYNLIEILGVLIDNAIDANLESKTKEKVYFSVKKEDKYIFNTRNEFKETPYDVIKEWFSKGTTTKGNEHGIGLYYVKKVCRRCGCDIECRNEIIKGKNWINFELRINIK